MEGNNATFGASFGEAIGISKLYEHNIKLSRTGQTSGSNYEVHVQLYTKASEALTKETFFSWLKASGLDNVTKLRLASGWHRPYHSEDNYGVFGICSAEVGALTYYGIAYRTSAQDSNIVLESSTDNKSTLEDIVVEVK